MTVAFQASLLDTALVEGPTVQPLGTLTRTLLTRGAWVDVLPGWVRGSDEVFQHLIGSVPWHAERRPMYERVVDVPRLLSWYGEGQPLPHPLLQQARNALSAHYLAELGEPFATAGLCYYRDGRDSVAWHGDTIGRSRSQDTLVAIVSFGAARRGDCCCGRASAVPPSASRWAMVTSWSWVGRASGRGSMRYPKQLATSDRASACSSDRAGSADTARQPCWSGVRPDEPPARGSAR